ncbi:MAG: Gfo/Idh/MocA family oxidoreductase [Planctomycetaceae bacterium]|jgi:predicted dehydrogenase|nr:Gfo/Idh/MocA family oxidoreductase [Planctomycetaceae bacterium]
MMKSTRRNFLKAATVTSVGFMVAEGNAQEAGHSPDSPNEKLGVACIGVGGKGGGDADNAAKFGNIVAICDVDKQTLENKGKGEAYLKAKQYVDFREMLEKHEKEIDIVTISTPDHMHAAATLMAMRMGKSCYTQKPLTRTIYEARKLAEVAKETGVCTQMGNQGTALDSSRMAIAQLKAGVIGKTLEVFVWSNRPVWAQGPNRRMTLNRFAKDAREKMTTDKAEKAIWDKFADIQRNLGRLDWKHWIGTAKYREFWPGIYHSFQWRGWWDFGSGALGDMACHQVTVPFAACGLKDPTWVRAKSTGHDFDSYPASSIIEFEFPANEERGKIPFWWYDRSGNRPPQDVFAPYGVEKPANSGVLIVGEKGAFYSSDDYCGKYELRAKGGEIIPPIPEVKVDYAEKKGNNDTDNMYELFRAVKAKDPKICHSNFIDRAGPLTETILLGNLAVWAAAEGGAEGAMGEWGEKIEWDAKNLVVTNLSSLKTPGVAGLIKPIYSEGYRLD